MCVCVYAGGGGWGGRGKWGVLNREHRMGILERSPPVHSETMSHIRPCDSRRVM